ncbi:MAG: phenylacetate--CoA ligase family protein, partial [Desulfohalobiaceae bacterium]
ECLQQSGLHVNEDHFLIELVDPETLDPVPDGQNGELVITTLTKEAFPMIRFRTGDLTTVIPEACPCGRTHRRISRILGRTDDMFTVRGVNVFPNQIEAVIFGIEGLTPHYQVVIDRGEDHLDKAVILVEAEDRLLTDSIREAQAIVELVEKELVAMIGVSFQVKLVEHRTLERFDGKANRIIDKRSY